MSVGNPRGLKLEEVVDTPSPPATKSRQNKESYRDRTKPKVSQRAIWWSALGTLENIDIALSHHHDQEASSSGFFVAPLTLHPSILHPLAAGFSPLARPLITY